MHLLISCAAILLATMAQLTAATSATIIQQESSGDKHPVPVGTSFTVSIPGTSLTINELMATSTVTNRTDKALDFKMRTEVSFRLSSYDYKTNYELSPWTNSTGQRLALSSQPFGLGPKGVFKFAAGFGTSGVKIFETTRGADGKNHGRFISSAEVKKGPYHLHVNGALYRLYPGSSVSGYGCALAFKADIVLR